MRIQVTVGDDLAKKIDSYADSFGVTRSAFCSMMIGQGIVNLENTKEVLKDLGNIIADKIQTSDK